MQSKLTITNNALWKSGTAPNFTVIQGEWKVICQGKWHKWLSLFHTKQITGNNGHSYFFGIKYASFRAISFSDMMSFKYDDHHTTELIRIVNKNKLICKLFNGNHFIRFYTLERKYEYVGCEQTTRNESTDGLQALPV